MENISCEMCGTFAGPDLEESEVDNVKMFLCKKCAKYGVKLSRHNRDEIPGNLGRA